jgi:integrase
MKFLDKQDKHGRWIYQYWDKSKQQSRYAHLGTADRKEALKRFKVKQAEEVVYQRNPNAVRVSGSKRFSEVMEEYCKSKKMSISSLTNHAYAAKYFKEAVKDRPIGQYTERDWFIFTEYCRNKGFVLNTIANYSGRLNAVFKYALKVKYIKENIVSYISTTGRSEIKTIPIDDLNLFLKFVKDNYSQEFYFYLQHTFILALRPAEGIYLHWEFVNMDSNKVQVFNAKENRFDLLPMIYDVKDFYIYNGVKETGKIHQYKSYTDIVWRFVYYKKKFEEKVKPFPHILYDFRKTRCSQLANAGVDPHDLMRFMRHRDFSITMKYYINYDLGLMKKRMDDKLKTSLLTSQDAPLNLLNFSKNK